MTGNGSSSGRAFGALVARLRAASDLPQKELARRLGVSRPYLANIERGEPPGPAVLAALAEWYPAEAAELGSLAHSGSAVREGHRPRAPGPA